MDTRQQKNKKVSTDEWYTPQWVIDTLGPFDLDPCAPIEPPYQTARMSFNKNDDGLKKEWPEGFLVWLNPPYSQPLLKLFCKKMADHGNGIALLVNRQDNILWQEIIFPTATSMLFMRKRVRFIRPDGTTGKPYFGSCLVAWGPEADRRLRQCDIQGKYIVLNS